MLKYSYSSIAVVRKERQGSPVFLGMEESGREFSLSENLMQCANGQLEMEDPEGLPGKVYPISSDA